MNYHNITKEDMNNGDGLRSVLWVAGCSHCCKECQNPQTWDPNGGIPFGIDDEKELFESLDDSYISGITFSGGDPLFIKNRPEIERLILKFRELYQDKKTIWMWTGFNWEDIYTLPYIKEIDVLIDGRFEIDKRDVSLKWKGSSNQRVIDVKKTLNSNTPNIPILYCSDTKTLDDEVQTQLFDAAAASCCKD